MHRRSFNELVAAAVALAAVAPAKLALAQVRVISINPQTALAIVNGIRAQQRREPLASNPTLISLAQAQANGMAQAETLSHSIVGGFGARLGGRFAPAAENIATGATELNGVFTQWVNSPAHYANILNRQVTAMGLAGAISAAGRYYWALILGRPR